MQNRAPKHDFTIYQGETWKPVLRIKDVNDVAVDLTGYSAKMEIRTVPGGTLLATPTLTLTPLVGQISIGLSKTLTLAMTTGGVYDIVLTSPATENIILLIGTIIFIPRVTQ